MWFEKRSKEKGNRSVCGFVISATLVFLHLTTPLAAQYASAKAGSQPAVLVGSLSDGHKQALENSWDSTLVVRNWKQASNGKWEVVVAAAVMKNAWCSLCIPVYHTVSKGQNLSTVAKIYKQGLSVSQLKRVNRLKSETVPVGKKLIVGYIALESSVATNENAEKMQDDHLLAEKSNISRPVTNLYSGEGFFATEWKSTPWEKALQIRIGCFKAETGWEDGKFYMLHNHIPAGSVVKILNPVNGKTIYAKVAAPLPNLKMNNGLQARVCTAAGAMLGIGENQVEELVLSY